MIEILQVGAGVYLGLAAWDFTLALITARRMIKKRKEQAAKLDKSLLKIQEMMQEAKEDKV